MSPHVETLLHEKLGLGEGVTGVMLCAACGGLLSWFSKGGPPVIVEGDAAYRRLLSEGEEVDRATYWKRRKEDR